MGRLGLEKREESKLKNISWRFLTIKSQSQGAEKVVITFDKPKNGNFLIATLLEVADKDDFECRNEIKVYFRYLGLSRFWCEEKTIDLLCQSIFTRFKFLAETKMEDTKLLLKEN